MDDTVVQVGGQPPALALGCCDLALQQQLLVAAAAAHAADKRDDQGQVDQLHGQYATDHVRRELVEQFATVFPHGGQATAVLHQQPLVRRDGDGLVEVDQLDRLWQVGIRIAQDAGSRLRSASPQRLAHARLESHARGEPRIAAIDQAASER
jgi:hypothetical protein